MAGSSIVVSNTRLYLVRLKYVGDSLADRSLVASGQRGSRNAEAHELQEVAAAGAKPQVVLFQDIAQGKLLGKLVVALFFERRLMVQLVEAFPVLRLFV